MTIQTASAQRTSLKGESYVTQQRLYPEEVRQRQRDEADPDKMEQEKTGETGRKEYERQV